MGSTRELENTLPFYPPERSGYKQGSLKFAVYSLISQDDAGRQRLLHDLNTDGLSTSNCCLAPEPDFAHRTLRDVYDYHIEVSERDDNEMHPHFFIVADQDDWKTNGVLLVNLQVARDLSHGPDENDDYEYVVGVGRCGTDTADCDCCNLEIGNVGWEEYKEEWQTEWDGEDPYTNKRYFKYHFETGEEN